MKQFWEQLKKRLANKQWTIITATAIIALIAHVLGYFGILIPTDYLIQEATFLITAIFGLISMWTNPLTKGIGDPPEDKE